MSEIHKGRLLMLAEKIEDPEQTPSFNMASFSDGCGTPHCVAGWAIHFWGNLKEADKSFDYIDPAMNILGLCEGQARPLFGGEFSRRPLNHITRAETAAELRRLAALA